MFIEILWLKDISYWKLFEILWLMDFDTVILYFRALQVVSNAHSLREKIVCKIRFPQKGLLHIDKINILLGDFFPWNLHSQVLGSENIPGRIDLIVHSLKPLFSQKCLSFSHALWQHEVPDYRNIILPEELLLGKELACVFLFLFFI